MPEIPLDPTDMVIYGLWALLALGAVVAVLLGVGERRPSPPVATLVDEAMDVEPTPDPVDDTTIAWRVPPRLAHRPVVHHRLTVRQHLVLVLAMLAATIHTRQTPAPVVIEGEVSPELDEPVEDAEPAEEDVPAAPETVPAAAVERPDPLNDRAVPGPYVDPILWDGTDRMPKLTPELLRLLDEIRTEGAGNGRYVELDIKPDVTRALGVGSGSWRLVNNGGSS